jgi:hypothetical protein
MDVCEHCKGLFHRWRQNQRFCNAECNRAFHIEERRQALAAWRAQKQEEDEPRESAA